MINTPFILALKAEVKRHEADVQPGTVTFYAGYIAGWQDANAANKKRKVQQ